MPTVSILFTQISTYSTIGFKKVIIVFILGTRRTVSDGTESAFRSQRRNRYIEDAISKYFWNISHDNVSICFVIEVGLREYFSNTYGSNTTQ